MRNETVALSPMPEKKPIRVYLVEDDLLLKQELCALLNCTQDIEICGEAADANSALSEIVQIVPDLILLDLVLKKSSGHHLLKSLRGLYPDIPVLVLSNHESRFLTSRSLQAGASGHLSRCNGLDNLAAAIRAVSGETGGTNPGTMQCSNSHDAGDAKPSNLLAATF